MAERSGRSSPRKSGSNAKTSSSRAKRREGASETVASWSHYGPSVSGWEAMPCFKEGCLFLLIDPVSHQWALYNDTFAYEMHATFVFGADCHVHPQKHPNVATTREESGRCETTVMVTVYPMETVIFLQGDRQRYRSTFEGKALSREYLEYERKTAAEAVARAFAAISTESRDAEATSQSATTSGPCEEEYLARCHAGGLPFVDPVFFPGDQALWPAEDSDGGARRRVASTLPQTPLSRGLSPSPPIPSLPPTSLAPCAWQRPCEYLPPSLATRVAVFCGPVMPRRVQRGRLGDSWFVSALAAVAENDTHVRALFGYLSGPSAEGVREASLGAHRVLLNRDGWWHQLVVDDYLPVVGRQPRYARSRDEPCELWVSLLEKAYAKRSGAYAHILGGDPLFAVRDLTGFPTTRLDQLFVESSQSSASADAFFSRLATDVENGHLYMFSTPDSLDPRSTSPAFKANGILVGYAYTAVGTFAASAEQHARERAQAGQEESRHVDSLAAPCAMPRLVILRNPWASPEQWQGKWRKHSPLWAQHRAAAVVFPGCAAGTDDTIALEWPEEMHRFFTGCGMAYCHFGFADYRMPCTFRGRVPEACVEVSVTEPTSLTFILSQRDHRGTSAQGEDYAPVMLCVACRSSLAHTPHDTSHTNSASLAMAPAQADALLSTAGGGGSGGEYTLLVNSSWDAESPSERFIFLQGRDIGLTYTFVPERSPYLVIPRRLVEPDGSSSGNLHTDPCAFHDTTRREDELPVVLGVLSQLPFTPLGQAQLRLRRLHEENPVFANYATFPNTSSDASLTVMAQKRVGCAPVVQVTSSLNSL